MEANKILLANQFKKELGEAIIQILKKLKTYEGEAELPVPVELLEFGFMIYNSQGCPEKIIESFLEKSFPEPDPKAPVLKVDESKPPNHWDLIRARDEKSLIEIGRKMVADEYSIFQAQSEKVLAFILANRKELIGDELEEKLWLKAEDLIKIAIRYAHFWRHPMINPRGVAQYTNNVVPKMSVKKEAEKWGLDIQLA